MEEILVGFSASPGTFEGKPLLLSELLSKKPKKNEKFVIVADFLTPLHTPYLSIAGAVVTEYGGMMAHSAIVCREMGIPCVTGAKGALEKLIVFKSVLVNGRTGKVYGQK